MKELITLRQANEIVLAATVIGPLIGLAWGIATRRIAAGLIFGLAIGLANLALWKTYNAITDRLGLDTVKNLLVNLALFVGIGVIAGFAIGLFSRSGKHPGEGGSVPSRTDGAADPRAAGEARGGAG